MIDVVFVKKHASPVCLIKSLLQTGAGSPVLRFPSIDYVDPNKDTYIFGPGTG